MYVLIQTGLDFNIYLDNSQTKVIYKNYFHDGNLSITYNYENIKLWLLSRSIIANIILKMYFVGRIKLAQV